VRTFTNINERRAVASRQRVALLVDQPTTRDVQSAPRRVPTYSPRTHPDSVYLAAASEAHAVALRAASRGVPVSQAMMSHFVTLQPDTHIDEAVNVLLQTSQGTFPVVDGNGNFVGILKFRLETSPSLNCASISCVECRHRLGAHGHGRHRFAVATMTTFTIFMCRVG